MADIPCYQSYQSYYFKMEIEIFDLLTKCVERIKYLQSDNYIVTNYFHPNIDSIDCIRKLFEKWDESRNCHKYLNYNESNIEISNKLK